MVKTICTNIYQNKTFSKWEELFYCVLNIKPTLIYSIFLILNKEYAKLAEIVPRFFLNEKKKEIIILLLLIYEIYHNFDVFRILIKALKINFTKNPISKYAFLYTLNLKKYTHRKNNLTKKVAILARQYVCFLESKNAGKINRKLDIPTDLLYMTILKLFFYVSTKKQFSFLLTVISRKNRAVSSENSSKEKSSRSLFFIKYKTKNQPVRLNVAMNWCLLSFTLSFSSISMKKNFFLNLIFSKILNESGQFFHIHFLTIFELLRNSFINFEKKSYFHFNKLLFIYKPSQFKDPGRLTYMSHFYLFSSRILNLPKMRMLFEVFFS